MSDAERELRAALADRFPREPDQRRVVGDAKLNEGKIAFDAVALNSWAAILREARDSGRTGALLDLVLEERPTDVGLRMQVTLYARSVGATLGGGGAGDALFEVLALAAEPASPTAGGLGDELQKIEEVLLDPAFPAAVRFRGKDAIDDDVLGAFLSSAPRVVHVSGRRSASGEIAFLDGQGKRAVASPTFLADVLGMVTNKVELVVLNGCGSEAVTTSLTKEVPFVIEVDRALDEPRAARFLGRLYQAMGFGKPLERAFAISSSQARLFDQVPDELVPELRTPGSIKQRGPKKPAIQEPTEPPSSAAEPTSTTQTAWKLWPNGATLRVRFLDGDASLRERVKKATDGWRPHVNLGFLFGDDPKAELHVSFNQPEGSWAYLGAECLRIKPDEANVNFGYLRGSPDEEGTMQVQHELGHVLGMIHEHQNPNAKIPWDRDAVYKFYMGPPNFWDKDTIDAQFLTLTSFPKPLKYRPFDPRSIMHYSLPKELTGGRLDIGRNAVLSPWDRLFAAQLYPPDIYAGSLMIGEPAVLEGTLGLRESHEIDVIVPASGRVTFVVTGDVPMALALRRADEAPHAKPPSCDPLQPVQTLTEDVEAGRYKLRLRHATALGKGTYRLEAKQ